MKYLFMLIVPYLLLATEINHKWVEQQLSILTSSQKEVIMRAYHHGTLLYINGESYGLTAATLTLVESSAGKFRSGDQGQSAGLTHMGLARTRELLVNHPIYEELLYLSDRELIEKLKYSDSFNMNLALLNFKKNFQRWGNYSKAVRAHNGYAPYKEFHNRAYYKRFINAMQVVKQVVKEEL